MNKRKRTKRDSPKWKLRSLCAGVLQAFGTGSDEIGQQLGVKEGQVREYVDWLYEKGYMRTFLSFPDAGIAENVLTRIELATNHRTPEHQQLCAVRGSASSKAISVERVSLLAALLLVAYLEQRSQQDHPTFIGISWGTHIRALIDTLAGLLGYGRSDHIRFENVWVFNVAGDMISRQADPKSFGQDWTTAPLDHPSSTLARSFAEVIGANVALFTGPGWLSNLVGDGNSRRPKTNEEIEETYQRAIELFSGYDGFREIFLGIGRRPPLKDAAHLVITGVGDKNTFQSMLNETEQLDHSAVQDVLRESIADISATPLMKSGFLNTAASKVFEQMILGLHRSDYQKLISRGRESDEHLGLMAITCNRPEAAGAAWAAGANLLVTDHLSADYVSNNSAP